MRTTAKHYADGVVARLAQELPDCKVSHWPTNASRYTFAAGRHELCITYGGSTYGASASAVPDSADRTLTVTVTVFYRSLRDATEAYDLVDRVLDALHGWRPAFTVPAGSPGEVVWQRLGGTAWRPTDDSFLQEKDGVWTWGLSFQTTRPQVAKATPDPTTPFTPTEIT